jgi:hypothetical protein
VREVLHGRTYVTALIAKEVRAAVAGVDEFEKEIERAGANGLVRLRVRRGENHLISVLRIP